MQIIFQFHDKSPVVMYQHCWDSGPSLEHIQALHNQIGEYMLDGKVHKNL